MFQMKMQTPGADRALGETSLLAGKSETATGFRVHPSTPINGQQQKRAQAEVGMDSSDLEFIRDAIDLATVRRFAPNKYQAGRLAGLAISLSIGPDEPGRIEIAGPLPKAETFGLEPVPFAYGCGGDDLPTLGFRDEAHGNMLYRVSSIGQLLDLAVESAAVLRRQGGSHEHRCS